MSRPTLKSIDEMFYSKSTEDEEKFRSKTIGLVSMETYKRHMSDVKEGFRSESSPKKVKIISESKPKKLRSSTLSFEFNQGNDILEQIHEKKDHSSKQNIITNKHFPNFDESFSKEENKINKSQDNNFELSFNNIGKDISIDTSFLPDKKRELEVIKEREKLKLKEFEQEEKLKQEIIEVVFSYWDGSGHRRSVHVQRNTTIGEFLEKCRIKLKSEFKEFSRLSSASLMYIKEDVILPHTITFHELIKTKARGKSGPLFHFNVFDDIREKSDVRKETTESHAGKVVKRQWYEKNKHVFPAYLWENYVPGKFNKPYSMRGD